MRAHGRQAAATLLHLGCGLGNGLANLHNARKGKVPVFNIVGDHATTHVPYDAQLRSDIETVARNVSPGFVRTSRSTGDLCRDAPKPLRAARPARPGGDADPAGRRVLGRRRPALPAAAAAAPRGGRRHHCGLCRRRCHSGGGSPCCSAAAPCVSVPRRRRAHRAHSGVTLLAEVFPTRMERGAGPPTVERIAHLAEMAGVQPRGYRASDPGRCQRRRCPSSPAPARRAIWCPRAARCTRSPRPRRMPRRA